MLSYFLIFMMVAIGVAPMLWEARRGKFDFFNLKNPFIIYYLLQLAISGLVTLIVGHPSEIGLDPATYSHLYEEALAVSMAGLLLFQIGYYTQSTAAIKIPWLLRITWIGNRYRWIVAMNLTIGMCAFLILLQMNGGLAAFLENRETFRAGGLVGQGIVIFPATSLMGLTALIFFLGNQRKFDTRARISKSIMVLMIALVPAILMGFRSALLLPVLQFMVVWHYAHRKIPAGKLVISLVTVGVAFTLYGMSRAIPSSVSISPLVVIETAVENPELAYAIVSRSKGTEVLASIINKLDQTGDYELGWRSLIEFVTIAVPKKLWEDKPQASSERFGTYFFARDFQLARDSDADVWGGVSPTAVGEFYWHFGWIGVVMGLYLLGRLAKVAYATLRRNCTNPSVLMIYAIFYTSFAMFAESIQNYANGLVMYGAAIGVTLFALTMRMSLKPRLAA